MEKVEISPIGLIFTFLYHIGLLYLALTRFPHHHAHQTPYDIVHVSIPVDTSFRPHLNGRADIHDLIVPEQTLTIAPENLQPVEQDRYYLPQELSQQVRVLDDKTSTLNIPIRQIVTMSLYINESGSVDDVTIDNAGVLTDDEKQQLISAFGKLIFLPGMRGEKIVKSLYRIQLEINRKVIIHR